jgi:hypothetical protein
VLVSKNLEICSGDTTNNYDHHPQHQHLTWYLYDMVIKKPNASDQCMVTDYLKLVFTLFVPTIKMYYFPIQIKSLVFVTGANWVFFQKDGVREMHVKPGGTYSNH